MVPAGGVDGVVVKSTSEDVHVDIGNGLTAEFWGAVNTGKSDTMKNRVWWKEI